MDSSTLPARFSTTISDTRCVPRAERGPDPWRVVRPTTPRAWPTDTEYWNELPVIADPVSVGILAFAVVLGAAMLALAAKSVQNWLAGENDPAMAAD